MVVTHWLRALCASRSKQRSNRGSFSKRTQHNARWSAPSPALAVVEPLEDRTLLAVGSIFIQATGTLVVLSDAADDIDVTAVGGNVLVNGNDPQTGPLAASQVQAISVTGGQGGNDIDLTGVTAADFTQLAGSAITVFGGDGNDTITASDLGGVYLGGHGNDSLVGGVGNDTIDGDDGHDTLVGNDGADSLIGEDGNDSIDAGDGDDFVDGGDGTDLLNGDAGADTIEGGDDSDTINGGTGDDLLNGGFSNDTLLGDDGNDTLFGGANDDLLLGGAGDDRLTANAGDDTLDGGTGQDTLNGTNGANVLNGGDGNDSIDGGTDGDTINGNAGDDTLDGGENNDLLVGGDGNDSLLGGPGEDTLDGSDGNDMLLGQGGDDTLSGGGGTDTIDGGTGDDLIQSIAPLFSISDAAVPVEGDMGTTNITVTVSLNPRAGETATVDFATANGTATAGFDYLPVSGTLTFPPGVGAQTINVPIIGDVVQEMDESFFINLSNASGATIGDGQAVVTIVDDEVPPPTLSIDDVMVTEGDIAAFGFLPAVDYPGIGTIATVASGDLDGDGDIDLATANFNGGEIAVLLNNGDGTFASPSMVDPGSTDRSISLAIADLDGDGDLDMVDTRQAGGTQGTEDVTILLNNGNATFMAMDVLNVAAFENGLTVNDFDGDGDIDVAIADGDFDQVSVLLNNGNGTFGPLATVATGDISIQLTEYDKIDSADLDGDGDVDLAIAVAGGLEFLLNNGSGTFAAPVAVAATIGSVEIADVDNDGDEDLIAAGAQVDVLLNNGAATFAAPMTFTTGITANSVLAADFDGDGFADLAVTAGGGATEVLLNQGNGTFNAPLSFAVQSASRFATAADFDGNGSIDLAVSSFSGDVSVLLNQNAGGGGNSGQFTVTLSSPAVTTITVDFATVDGSATAGIDYVASSGTLTFMPGQTTQTISVPIISDSMPELNEDFFVMLMNPSGATIADGQGQATIVDDDSAPASITVTGDNNAMNLANALAAGGGAGVVITGATLSGHTQGAAVSSGTYALDMVPDTYGLSRPGIVISTGDVNDYNTAPSTAPTGSTGYGVAATAAQENLLDQVTGGNQTHFDVTQLDITFDMMPGFDTLFFEVVFGSEEFPTFVGQFSDGFGLFVNNTNIATVAGQPVNIDHPDMTAMTGTILNGVLAPAGDPVLLFSVNVGAGSQNNTLTIIIGDVIDSSFDTTAYLASLGGTIPAPAADIDDVSVMEGNMGTTNAVFTVTLSEPSTQPITVDFATADDTATAGVDYQATNGTLTFAPGVTTQQIMVPIIGDTMLEPDETFFVNLSNPTGGGVLGDDQGLGTIIDDDFSANMLSISDLTIPFEGDTGVIDAVFTVTLMPPANQTATVDFSTANGTAIAGMDYVATTGTLTFAPGQTTATITVPIIGDTVDELDETFSVNLSNPMNALIAMGTATGTIVDDDDPIDPVGDLLFGSDGSDTIIGAEGADTLDGGSGDDSLVGDDGDDILRGRAGKDTLNGGAGNDLLDGGRNSDTIDGGTGNDTVVWESGDGFDQVDGGLGFDELDVETLHQNDRITVEAATDGRFRVLHRIPSDASDVVITAGMTEILSLSTDGGADRITIDDLTGVQHLQLINIDAGNGADSIDASAQANPSIDISVLAGAGNDTVVGGAGNDVIDGETGNDILSGGDGADTINGSAGVDKLFGGDGNDVLLGGDGRDFIYGEDGNDSLDGGNQNDDLFGGIGDDVLAGAAGDDSLLGENGNDSLSGGDGADTLRGGKGDDSLLGDAGVDSLAGDDGADTLRGGADGDTIVGGEGNDLMFGGIGSVLLLDDGDDFLNGNAGDDTLDGERGRDSLFGGSGRDVLLGGFGDDQLNGNSGADSLRGADGNDLLRGAAGNDTLNGGHGEDRLFGQMGDDALSGHDGNDRLNGGGGRDTLHGGDGDDTLRGGAGVDLLIGHDGNDNLNGQGGDPDTLVGGDSFDILDDNGGVDVVDNDFAFFAEWIDGA